MIVTLTPNPSVDRTIEIDALVRGAVIRAKAVHVDASGKGVNVARALVANGVKARAVLPSGGAEGAQLAALIAEEGIETTTVPVAMPVRANVTVVEPDGTTTKLNEPGPVLDVDEVEALVAATIAASRGASWLACCGSLPPGAPPDLYARLAASLRDAGVKVAVDSSGPALAAAVDAGPALVKPNDEELAEVTGMRIETIGDVIAAAGELRRRGVGTVLASLGRNGALLVDADGAVHGSSTVIRPRSTVGAGDALLAGFLAAGGAGRQALAEGLAWGAAAVSLPGTQMPTPADLDRSAVSLHDHPDVDRPLGGSS